MLEIFDYVLHYEPPSAARYTLLQLISTSRGLYGILSPIFWKSLNIDLSKASHRKGIRSILDSSSSDRRGVISRSIESIQLSGLKDNKTVSISQIPRFYGSICSHLRQLLLHLPSSVRINLTSLRSLPFLLRVTLIDTSNPPSFPLEPVTRILSQITALTSMHLIGFTTDPASLPSDYIDCDVPSLKNSGRLQSLRELKLEKLGDLEGSDGSSIAKKLCGSQIQVLSIKLSPRFVSGARQNGRVVFHYLTRAASTLQTLYVDYSQLTVVRYNDGNDPDFGLYDALLDRSLPQLQQIDIKFGKADGLLYLFDYLLKLASSLHDSISKGMLPNLEKIGLNFEGALKQVRTQTLDQLVALQPDVYGSDSDVQGALKKVLVSADLDGRRQKADGILRSPFLKLGRSLVEVAEPEIGWIKMEMKI
ncbi:hypothetical protein JCM5350_000955 [Sporobolomyces pararoseus]